MQILFYLYRARTFRIKKNLRKGMMIVNTAKHMAGHITIFSIINPIPCSGLHAGGEICPNPISPKIPIYKSSILIKTNAI